MELSSGRWEPRLVGKVRLQELAERERRAQTWWNLCGLDALSAFGSNFHGHTSSSSSRLCDPRPIFRHWIETLGRVSCGSHHALLLATRHMTCCRTRLIHLEVCLTSVWWSLRSCAWQHWDQPEASCLISTQAMPSECSWTTCKLPQLQAGSYQHACSDSCTWRRTMA